MQTKVNEVIFEFRLLRRLPKPELFEKDLHTVDFFNGVFFRARVDRGKRRFSKTMTSNLVDRQKRFENAMIWKISVFKIIWLRVDGA